MTALENAQMREREHYMWNATPHLYSLSLPAAVFPVDSTIYLNNVPLHSFLIIEWLNENL